MHFSKIRLKSTTAAVEPVHVLMNNKVSARMAMHLPFISHPTEKYNIDTCIYLRQHNGKLKKIINNKARLRGFPRYQNLVRYPLSMRVRAIVYFNNSG